MPQKKPLEKATPELAREYEVLVRLFKNDPNVNERDDIDELNSRFSRLTFHYDWKNYEFTDPTTGKKGLKDITGFVIIPPCYDGFIDFRSFMDSPHAPVRAFVDGKYELVAADGSGEVLLRFKQKSLRDTVIDALDFIGVKDFADFDLKKEFFNNPERGIHDSRHLYRVMIATALIAQKLNEPRRGLLAFCGAFIHDQARNNNGGDPEHGLRAAKTKWNIHSAIWKKYELTPDEQDYVRSAVSLHNSRHDSGFKVDNLVKQILHDADSFDRCRFHRTEARLNWDLLSLPQLKDKNGRKLLNLMIGETEAVWCFTKDIASFIPFKDFLENIR